MISDVIHIALRAGREILGVYEDQLSVNYKEDRTPLTEADRKAHTAITTALRDTTPHIPVISEEGQGVPYEERKRWERFWLVDPLDGTREFIRRNGEFTVNIALVEGRDPALGVVYAPARNLLFFAQKGKGAYRVEVKEDSFNLKEAGRLPLCSEGVRGRPLRVVASRSHMNEETRAFVEKLRSRFGDVELVSVGSSLKFCLVAEGKADIYPRLGPTMEWDTAAAHIVAAESGCEVRTLSGEPLRYNKPDLRNPHFLVIGRELAYILEEEDAGLSQDLL